MMKNVYKVVFYIADDISSKSFDSIVIWPFLHLAVAVNSDDLCGPWASCILNFKEN